MDGLRHDQRDLLALAQSFREPVNALMGHAQVFALGRNRAFNDFPCRLGQKLQARSFPRPYLSLFLPLARLRARRLRCAFRDDRRPARSNSAS